MAKKKTKEKPYRSINGRMYLVIVLLVFFAAMICIIYTSRFYLGQLLIRFATNTSIISDSYADFFDDPQLDDLVMFVTSDDYQNIKKQAKAENNPELIRKAVQEAGLDEFVETNKQRLNSVQENNKIADLYIASCDMENSCYYILRTNDILASDGDKLLYETRPEEIRNLNSTTASYSLNLDGPPEDAVARIVSMSPIGVSADKRMSIWLVSEEDAVPFVNDLFGFIGRMFLFLLIVSSVFAIVGVLILRHQLTSPIIKLKRSVVNFEKHNTAEKSALPVDPGINRPDEIGDLSRSLYSLEQNVYETQSALSKLSEEKGRMSAQLSIAASIQQGVLPSEFPTHECFELYGLMQPAKEVGGDFFDYFMVDDSHLAMVIADVSDKGIPASLFMMTSKTLLKSQALSGKSPAAALESVNNSLCENNPANYFVTVWFGILDLCTGHMVAANGGHEFPMVSFGGKPFEVYKDIHGLALGSYGGMKYKEYELQFEEGDRIIVYSDGATDAINQEEAAFGIENLEKTVQELGNGHNAEQLVHGVLSKLMDYSKDTYQFDDITLLSMTYLKKKSTEE